MTQFEVEFLEFYTPFGEFWGKGVKNIWREDLLTAEYRPVLHPGGRKMPKRGELCEENGRFETGNKNKLTKIFTPNGQNRLKGV